MEGEVKKYLLRLPPSLYKKIEKRAQQNGRSVNQEMIKIFKVGLDSKEVHIVDLGNE